MNSASSLHVKHSRIGREGEPIMPLLVTVKEWGLGARPKRASPQPVAAPAPKRKNLPTSVQQVDRQLRLLGPYPMVTGPYDADDYDALTRRRLDWTTQRSRLLELRRQLAQKTDNDAIQAKTTEEIAVDDPEAKKKARQNLTRVKQSEAWRHKQLSPMQRQAEIEIEAAWRIRTAGMGAPHAKYGPTTGPAVPPNAEFGAKIEAFYRDWGSIAKDRKININAMLAIISEPKTLPEVEREYRMETGQALKNHQRGLDLWCELRGWSRAHVSIVVPPVHSPTP